MLAFNAEQRARIAADIGARRAFTVGFPVCWPSGEPARVTCKPHDDSDAWTIIVNVPEPLGKTVESSAILMELDTIVDTLNQARRRVDTVN